MNTQQFLKLLFLVTFIVFPASGNTSDPVAVLKKIARVAVDTLSADSSVNALIPETAKFDVSNLSWNGQSIALDLKQFKIPYNLKKGAPSIKWVLETPAYGSSIQKNEELGAGEFLEFQPDVAGVWKIAIKRGGNTILRTVSLRLLNISKQHPRIFLNEERLEYLRSNTHSKSWKKLKKIAGQEDGEMLAKALVGVITDQPKYCRGAAKEGSRKLDKVSKMKSLEYGNTGELALVYDWCYHHLTSSEKKKFLRVFNKWGDLYVKQFNSIKGAKPDRKGLGNYWPRFTYSFGVIGLAMYGDDHRAMEWIDFFRHQRWPIEKSFLDFIAEGGGWPEGIVYDAISNYSRMRVLDAWKIATGENLFVSSEWFKERFPLLLMQHWPGKIRERNKFFHPYASNGDYERGRGTMDSYWQVAAMILVNEFPNMTRSKQLRAYLNAPETAELSEFIQYAEYLWFRPGGPTEIPDIKSYYDKSLGNIFLRSGWPDGADDLDTDVTHINFRSGDFFVYHQHLDQNSFILYKKAPLALDSGIYSGNGLSAHDRNYYIRSIAHNTLVVFNEDEDFTSVRAYVESNDGGQRSMDPATRAPQSLDVYKKHKKHYDTGDVLAFHDDESFSYIIGDATKAYNSTKYNQASDTGFKKNIAKLNLFQREFLYYRSIPENNEDYVVIYDRVEVTKPKFSGKNTKLLFHVQNKPSIETAGKKLSEGEYLYSRPEQITAVNGEGKLVISPLLPKNSKIRVVGGVGKKAYWVNGTNFDWQWGKGTGIASNFEKESYGPWRVELEPGDQELKHNFLTVLYPTDKSNKNIPKLQTIDTGLLEGVHILDPNLNRLALFHKKQAQRNMVKPITLTFTPNSESTLVTVFGLNPGDRYTVRSVDDSDNTIKISSSPDGESVVDVNGILAFTR